MSDNGTSRSGIDVIFIPADHGERMTWRQVDRDLDAFQGLVGGGVQVILLVPGDNDPANNVTLWCNEDIAGLNLRLNCRATRLYHQAGGMPWNAVMGDTFITGGTDPDGETLSLPPEHVEQLHLSEAEQNDLRRAIPTESGDDPRHEHP